MVKNKTQKNKHNKSSKKRSSVQKKNRKSFPVKSPDFQKRRDTPNYALAVFFFCMIIGSYVFLYHYFSKKNNLVKGPFDQQVEAIIDQRKNDFDRKYPFGYKIVALNNDGIILSKIDSLPKHLVIPWNFVSLKRVPLDLKAKKSNLVIIKVPSIQFLPAGIDTTQSIVGVDRVKGRSAIVQELGSKGLYLEIIEAYENQLICLFGMK